MSDEAERGGASTSSGVLGENLGTTLLRVAWLSILLGFAMEILLLVVAAGLGSSGSDPFVADLVGGVTWSVIVCTGVAVGTAASRMLGPAMGLAGLLAAPIAFEVSRILQKGTAQALAAAGPNPGAEVSPVLLAAVKGIEYGLLALAIAWIWRRPWGGAAAHIGVGLLVGLVFGGVILALTFGASPQPMPAAALIPRGVNEVLFPVGCSLVLFTARSLAQRTAEPEGED